MIKQAIRRVLPGQVIAAYRSTKAAFQMSGELRADPPLPLRQWVGLWKTIRQVLPDSFGEVPRFVQLHRLMLEMDRSGIRGDIVECGVYRGGSAAILGYGLRHSRSQRHLWLFDSFQGMPPTTKLDGQFAQSLEGQIVGDELHVRKLLAEAKAPLDRIHIAPGWFNETFKNLQVGCIAMLHLDVDWYESYKLCLDRFYDLIEPGGVVILDDYDWFPGCKAALDEFARDRALSINLQRAGDAPPFFYKRK